MISQKALLWVIAAILLFGVGTGYLLRMQVYKCRPCPSVDMLKVNATRDSLVEVVRFMQSEEVRKEIVFASEIKRFSDEKKKVIHRRFNDVDRSEWIAGFESRHGIVR